jgi:3-hydroxyacyl-[acyl-carrier-protein] dehydratase
MIDRRALKPLTLGPQDIERLIPHRAPLMLLDGVEAIATDPPALRAFKEIRRDEPVFAGHFPVEPVWPGAYCIEGLAQACALLGAIRADGRPRRALLVAADVKLTAPVLPDQRLEYLVVWSFSADTMFRFEVEASVDRRVCARGTLTLAEVPR